MKISTKKYTEVYRKTDGECAYCGEDGYSIDHLLATKNGGLNNLENLVIACMACNNSKKTRSVEEFRIALYFKQIGLSGLPIKYYDRLVELGIQRCDLLFAHESALGSERL